MQHDSCSVKLAAGDADALDRLFHFGLCAQSHLGDCSYLPGAMERKYSLAFMLTACSFSSPALTWLGWSYYTGHVFLQRITQNQNRHTLARLQAARQLRREVGSRRCLRSIKREVSVTRRERACSLQAPSSNNLASS